MNEQSEVEVFDEEDILERGGDKEGLYKIVDIFLDQMPSLIEAMDISITKGDLVIASRHAHLIKGTSSRIGADGLYLQASVMERACNMGDCSLAERIMTSLRGAYDEFRSYFTTHCA